MAEDTVDIIIHPDGRVEIQVCGVKGERCLEVTEAVEEALGGQVQRDFTAEMYETEEESTKESDIQKLGG